MGVYIPNMSKPQNITRCSYKINPEECKCIYTDKVFEETLALIVDHPCDDCPLIEIDLVRCGECKWSYIDEQYEGTLWCKVHFHHYRVNSDGFCNYGERRADCGWECNDTYTCDSKFKYCPNCGVELEEEKR